MIKAILFDMGNTLLEFETEPWPVLAKRALLSVYENLRKLEPNEGLPPFDRFHERFVEIVEAKERGEPGREVPLAWSLSSLLESFSWKLEPDRLPELLHCHYEPIVSQVSLYPDVMQTLVRLRSDGMRIGLVSNTLWPKEFHLRDLARYEILHLFDSMVFSSDLGYAKPHPRIFNHSLRELGVVASEAVFVGDRLDADIAGAKGVGMLAVQKAHPLRTPFDHITPDALIETLSDLPPLLDSFERERLSARAHPSGRRC
jgi:putative hydrolase of the HAD superfamily